MAKLLSAKNINQIINHGKYFVKFFQIPGIFQKMLYTVKFAGVLIAHKVIQIFALLYVNNTSSIQGWMVFF